MSRLTVRDTTVNLPAFLEESTCTSITPSSLTGGLVSSFDFGDIEMRTMNLTDMRLTDGKVHEIRVGATEITRAEVHCTEFSNCELSSLTWTGGEISRTRFSACKLLGAKFENVALKHVVFVDCKMDYATFNRLRTLGPVMFIHCSLREAEFTGCEMTRTLLDECDLTLTTFGRGNYKGCDLRGNDISALRRVSNLRRTVLSSTQLIDLSQALAAELEIAITPED